MIERRLLTRFDDSAIMNRLRRIRCRLQSHKVGWCFVILLFSCGVANFADTLATDNEARTSTMFVSTGEPMQSHPYIYSYIDKSGEVIIDASKYQAARDFSDGLAAVASADGRWGFIDKSGKEVISPQFEQALGFSEGLAGVSIGGFWGFIDKTGRVVIEPQFGVVNVFSEGIAVVMKVAQLKPRPTGANQHVTEAELGANALVSLRRRRGLTSEVQQSAEVLLINRTGQAVLALKLDEVQLSIYEGARFSEGLIDAYDCAVGKIGFIDKQGEFVIKPRYSQAAPFSEGLARVAVDDQHEEKIGFIDREGNFKIAPKFNTDADFRRNSTNFSAGLASLTEGLRPTVTEESRFVYLNKKGEIALRTSFFYAGRFSEGLASVFDDSKSKWGFIDRSGNVVIPLRYDSVSDFSEGLASVGILTN